MESGWVLWLVLVLALVAALVARRRSRIGVKEARQALRDGAIVVDVRRPEEYAERHLDRAINVPLDQLPQQIEQRVPVKDVVVLCHCQSGRRSARATGLLRGMGYQSAYNLGSYQRASSIVGKRA